MWPAAPYPNPYDPSVGAVSNANIAPLAGIAWSKLASAFVTTLTRLHVNPTLGNDVTGDGTLVKPYQRIRRAMMDLGPAPQIAGDVEILVHGIGSTEDVDIAVDVLPGGRFRVICEATLIVAGVVSAYTARDMGTRTPAQLTDGTTPIDWATLVGKRIRFTNGTAHGGISFVTFDYTANKARITTPQKFDPAVDAAPVLTADPTVGDTFVVEELFAMQGAIAMKVGGVAGTVAGSALATIENAAFAATGQYRARVHAVGGACMLVGCRSDSPYGVAISGDTCKVVSCWATRDGTPSGASSSLAAGRARSSRATEPAPTRSWTTASRSRTSSGPTKAGASA